MTTSAEFSAKIAGIKLAMEREEWARAIEDLERIGPIPDKFLPIASNILFHLYIARNQYEKLVRLSGQLDPAKAKDSISALLLLRDRELDYAVTLPAEWEVAEWERAIESHLFAGKLEPGELPLCLHFLSLLNRPRLLEQLHLQMVRMGGSLDSESMQIVLRCLLKSRWFEEARRFVWIHNLNDIAFERFSFLIDEAEKSGIAIPESDDKFLTFLRYKFGSSLPERFSGDAGKV